MPTYSRAEAADRAGVSVDWLTRLVDLEILKPAGGDRFTPGDSRRAELVQSLEKAGIPVEGLAAALRGGTLSLDFFDAPAYDRFSLLSDVTFRQLSERTGVPINLVTLIREVAGSAAPDPDDRVREEVAVDLVVILDEQARREPFLECLERDLV